MRLAIFWVLYSAFAFYLAYGVYTPQLQEHREIPFECDSDWDCIDKYCKDSRTNQYINQDMTPDELQEAYQDCIEKEQN